MCYNCGCHSKYDDMGNHNNITEDTFKHLAEHMKKSLPETKFIVYNSLKAGKVDTHLEEMFEKASKAWGQSIDEAKKNTLDLLKIEVSHES